MLQKRTMKEKTYTITEQGKLQVSQTPKTIVWTREKINHLIELYKKHECLWNHWHEAYKSKDKRKRAIEEICEALKIEKFEFGKKIHNLRNQFNTEMKKLEQRLEESGVEDKNNPEVRCKWNHFESLMFLRNIIEPRPGGYQSTLQPPKKMRLKFDISNSEDELNISSALPSGSNITTNADNLSGYQCEDNMNDEVITDDYQSFENEILEIETANSSEEVCDQKYVAPHTQELSLASSHNLNKSKYNKLQNTPQNPTACSFSQAIININEDTSITENNSKKTTTAPSHSHLLTTSPSPVLVAASPITSCNTTSNRPASILRDQWDAFGELVANEFRNLNSENSRKRLKRKIMQAMLEVGEEDDQLTN